MTDGWWIITSDVPRGSTPGAWVVGWLPKGHRHLWLARRIDDGADDSQQLWHILDPASYGLLAVVGLFDGDYVAGKVAQGCTAALVPIAHDPARAYPRGWMTCVAMAKYVTGFRAWWACTPRMLIREAARRGCKVVHPCST